MKQIRRPSLTLLYLTGVVTGCGGSDSTGPSGDSPPPAPNVASVVVTPAATTFATLGETVQLSASASDASGNTISGETFTWSSSSTSVATVSSSGLVTAVANGSATITATADGINGTATITVQAPELYVTNMGDGSISVVDIGNGSVIATIGVGTTLGLVGIIPSLNRAYVGDLGENNIHVRDSVRKQWR